MLEEEIIKLKSAVIELTAIMYQVHDLMLVPKEKRIPEEPSKEPEETVTEEPEKATPKESPTTVTHDELHDMCLAIVRKTPTAKKKIKKILSSRLVKELPLDELEGIKAQLEAL